MDYKPFVGILAALLIEIANILYIRGIVKGTVKPNPYPFLVWAVQGVIGIIIALSNGAEWGVASAILGPVWCVTFAIIGFTKFGHRSWSVKEVPVYILIVIAGIVWLAVSNPVIAVICLTISSNLGMITLFRKAWNHPYTETLWVWGLYIVVAALGIVALGSYSFVTLLGSCVTIIFDLILIILLISRRKMLPNPNNERPEPELIEAVTLDDDELGNVVA